MAGGLNMSMPPVPLSYTLSCLLSNVRDARSPPTKAVGRAKEQSPVALLTRGA